ncbi:hypothetical protein ACMFMG_010481 [Clarireedia jacksonii]
MRTTTILCAASALAGIAHASVTCLKVGATGTARWTNSAGKSCTWSGLVGGNFGTNAANGGDCNGRCGAGCTGAALGNY